MSDILWSLSDPLLNSMANSPERLVVRGHFADICSSVTDPDVTTFAGELLQDSLISEAGHSATIAVTGLPPRDKLGNLLSEVMSRVSCSQDKFYRFVAILETRNFELASTLKSDYKLRQRDSQHLPRNVTTEEDQYHSGQDTPPFSKKRKEHDPCAEYVTHLQRAYQDPTHIWDPLPQCQHIRLAMIKEKGKRRGGNDGGISEKLAKGNVDKILEEKVHARVDMDKLFDEGMLDEDHQVILVEGGPGMGKTSLAFHYFKKWTDGMLNSFGAVALVHLRDLHLHVGDSTGTCTLSQLLSLASANHMQITKEMANLLLDKLKMLLILDGLDELPVVFKRESFISDLLPSVSSQTKILVTSRPDSSLHLHGKVNRVEILGFTAKDIDEYFRSAFLQELHNEDVHSACKKLTDHFQCHPVIHSCCYVPLNAAILAHIYIYRNKTLPITRFELFRELVLCCIVREQSKYQPERDLEHVLSFEDLPLDVRNSLENLCEVAYKGVKENRVSFTQKELLSSKDLISLGLLLIVPGFGLLGGKCITYNFIHLAVQELLAAYHISQLEADKHAQVFSSLLTVSRYSYVLQFYSAFTHLANKQVQNLIARHGFSTSIYSKKAIDFLNCFFEAQIQDLSFYKQVRYVTYKLNLSQVVLTPFDCLSVRYFLSCIYPLTRGTVTVDLTNCHIDSHSLSLLLGIHEKTSNESVLQNVRELDVIWNEITNSGIVHMATALSCTPNSTLEDLRVGDASVTDEGIVPLLKALPRTLRKLQLQWSSTYPDETLKKVGVLVSTSGLHKVKLYLCNPPDEPLQTVEAVDTWFQKVDMGGRQLLSSLVDCQLKCVSLVILLNFTISNGHPTYRNSRSKSRELCQKTVASINSRRQQSNLPSLYYEAILCENGLLELPA